MITTQNISLRAHQTWALGPGEHMNLNSWEKVKKRTSMSYFMLRFDFTILERVTLPSRQFPRECFSGSPYFTSLSTSGTWNWKNLQRYHTASSSKIKIVSIFLWLIWICESICLVWYLGEWRLILSVFHRNQRLSKILFPQVLKNSNTYMLNKIQYLKFKTKKVFNLNLRLKLQK